jgi:hypothetical protein
MLKRGNSKGLSTIVATLLIILLTLVAVGIIWVVVKNVLNQNAEQVSFGRFTVDLDIVRADIINDTAINLTVKRDSGDGELYGVLFIVYDKDNSEVVRYNVPLQELEEKRFNIILSVLNTSNVKKVSIAPVFMLESGKEFIGDVLDEYTFAANSGAGCTSGAQCSDYDSCTTDGCFNGSCTHLPIVSCSDGDGCCPAICASLNDSDCSGSPSPPVPILWTGELVTNGGFDSGNLNAWYTYGSYFAPTNSPTQGGSAYGVYYSGATNAGYLIHQNVSLATWAAYINNGTARINMSGWGISSEYPNHDIVRIRFTFYSAGGVVLGSPLDSGAQSNSNWWRTGVSNYIIPSGTNSVMISANIYDPDLSSAGAIDSFSVRLGYF